MGCDTKGFVLTKEKDVFKVWDVICKSLIDEMMKNSDEKSYMFFWDNAEYKHPQCNIIPDIQMLIVSFKYKNENRDLHVHLKCDSDYSECRKGKKIIISLGAWGSSIELVSCVLQGLKKFGPTYIIENDCSDDWKEL